MERRPLQAKVTEEAWRAWDRFLTREGAKFTTVIEAIGEQLAAGKQPIRPTVTRRAKELDRQRSTRHQR